MGMVVEREFGGRLAMEDVRMPPPTVNYLAALLAHAMERPVAVRLTADQLEAILTKTKIAKTKKLRPRLEAMAAEGKAIDLEIGDWYRILLALCTPEVDAVPARKRLLRMATTIATQLAGALGIEPPNPDD
jgi:hypothetical protein